MLPGNVLSVTSLPSAFLAPRAGAKVLLVEYHIGGTDIGDATAGLRVKTWTAQMVADAVTLTASGVSPYVVQTIPNLVELSFAFDSAMRPFLAYQLADDSAKYYWYDTVLAGYTTTTLPAGAAHPRMALDDSRELQSSACDVIIAYERAGNLYFLAQRDRFLIEYLLGAVPVGTKLDQIYMNTTNRFQFRFIALS